MRRTREQTKITITTVLKSKRCLMRSYRIASELELSTSYILNLLSELRKEKKIVLYCNKYWGIK